MLIDNKISRFLTGPYIYFGIIFLLSGVLGILSQRWVFGGINLFIAAFLYCTYSGVEIDTKKRVFREYNKWFGLFKTGKWKSLDNYLGVTLVPISKVYTMYSRSNRRTSSAKKEFRIYLVNKAKKPSVAIKKCKTLDQAQNSLDEFSIWLKMPVFSIKK
ncbi:MAG: hypothetical protein ABFS16_06850 [Bacteroidota bacterium]